MKENVLAIHCTLQPDGRYAYDGNVAIASREKLLMAVPEERVTRQKYDGGFKSALEYCLRRSRINPEDFEAVVISTFGQPTVLDRSYRSRVCDIVEQVLGATGPIEFAPSHHECHALAAAALCSFDRALIAVIDNEGSIIGERASSVLWRNMLERTSFYLKTGDSLKLVAREHDGPGEVGLGKAYSKITRYIGFASYLESGKTMGLAPFGAPGITPDLPLFEFAPDGKSQTTLQNSDDGIADLEAWFHEKGQLLPGRRAANSPIRRIDAQLAFWIQRELERIVTGQVSGLVRQLQVRHLCVTGGVAMNSVLNRRLADETGVSSVFVPPAPGDSGMAVGAAVWYFLARDGALPRWHATPFLGGAYSDREIEEALKKNPDLRVRCSDTPTAAANAIRDGHVIGWFQGPSEHGPRALGNRSILADASNAWMKEILNHGVKGREWFRPYAPAALESDAHRFFDLCGPEPFMMKIARAKAEACEHLPACVHVDRTSRIQTVCQTDNPKFAELIGCVANVTGFPVVLNTSFNLGGEPIVEAPDDAIRSFRQSEWMDVLFLGPYEVRKG